MIAVETAGEEGDSWLIRCYFHRIEHGVLEKALTNSGNLLWEFAFGKYQVCNVVGPN